MVASPDGGGGISVDPGALTAAAGRVRSASAEAGQVASGAALNACIDVGSAELSAALSTFDMTWSATAERVAGAGEQLAAALAAAASAYVQTDQAAIPGATP